MNEYKKIEECRELVRWAFKRMGHPYLCDKINISFNKRFTRRMGDASFITKQIRLSGSELWARATPEQRRQTIIHEACHIVQALLSPSERPHGPVWRQLMVKCGLEPKRCHSVSRAGLKRNYKRRHPYY